MMATSEPPYLPIGTDVSAKYRGAFCEAKVKRIAKSLKCKVFVKEIQSSLHVTDEFITGPLLCGAIIEVRHPDTGRVMEGTITKMLDSSMYTVVFDDGDERTLRRTQLCLKGDKHFIESETLDNLPLSNPEHFGTPVISGKGKRNRSSTGTGGQDDSDESSDDESDTKDSNQELVGKVMFYDAGDKKRPYLLPVLVVTPEAHPVTLKSKDHLLVRSFKDNKFLSPVKKELIPFARETVLKNEDKTLKVPMEKALLYIDNHELPLTWNKVELFGPDYESDFIDDKSSDDNEPSEEEDRFVAQLYKFCDDRGTPINKAPSVGSKDLNLYKLFKIVQNLGGYNRVTNQMKWRLVYSKMLLPPSNTASTQIKNAYKKYLHAFEDFYRKLGSTMGTISRPGRSRHDSGRGILNFRSRDKEPVTREPVTKEKMTKEVVTKEPVTKELVTKEKVTKESVNKEKVTKEVVTKEPAVIKEIATKEIVAKDTVKGEEKGHNVSKESSKDEMMSEKPDDKVTVMETDREQATPVVNTPIGTPKRPKSARLKAEARLIKDETEKVTKEEKKDKKEIKKAEPKAVKKLEDDSTNVKTELKTDKDDSKKEKDDVKNDKDETKKDKEERKKDKEEGKKDKDEEKKEKVEGKKEKEEGRKEKEEGKREVEKKPPEKKEVKVKVVKKEQEENKEPKEQKKLGRRRTRTDEEPEGKKEKKEIVKDEVKDKKNEQKEKEASKESQKATEKDEKKAVKKEVVHKATGKKDEKVDNKSDDSDVPPTPPASGAGDLPVGTKMKVRYGRGRNQREYEAKILEVGPEVGHRQYLVHYAGWNNRHDEWIRPERIVKILEKPEQKVKAGLKPSPKLPRKPAKKKILVEKAPASPSSVTSSESGTTPGRGRPPGKAKTTTPSAVASAVAPAAKGRPTRSNSVEQMVVQGLQAKRRPKRSVEKMESSKGSESEESDQTDGEEETGTEPEKKDQVKNTMPSIATSPVMDKSTDDLEEDTSLDRSIDRSPPQLSKMTDIVKDKLEGEEKEETKLDLKETDDTAPILKVVEHEKVDEPILQKIEAQLVEAQLVAASPPSVVKLDNKDKDTKKKETVDKKNKKGLFKCDTDEAAKKIEKVVDLKVSPVVNKFPEDSPYEFKDEVEFEPEFHRDRKKPIVLMEDCRKESPKKESPRKESPRRSLHDNEGSNLLQKIEKEEVGIVPVVKNLTDAKDFSKSDSEVERRGRKRKEVKEKEVKENLRKGRVAQVDKTATVSEIKTSASPERRAFITLAEKKHVYSVFIKSAEEPQEEAINTDNQKPDIDTEPESKEPKKPADSVVVHTALDTVKTIDIEAGVKTEMVTESGDNIDLMTPTIVKDELIPVSVEEKKSDATETEKKKVRKKSKKKLNSEELQDLYGPKKKIGGRRRRCVENQEKESLENSANVESKSDIDLRCDEKIRSRSASPESKKPNINVIQETQGFEPLFEAVECKLKESQQNQESAVSKEFKSTPFKGDLFANTPPSTPEHDSDGASQNSQEQVKINVCASASNLETNSKVCVNPQPVGSESPWGIGNTSPSSGSSGVVAGSEGSIDVAVHSTKRRRESDEPTPTKRRKRVSRNKSYNRSKAAESDSEDASNLSAKCRSPHYTSDSYAPKLSSNHSHRNRSPRPPKYNFNLDEGKYLEGNERIAFLVDKVQEIRKIYMSLKAEVACIDRRRKRARRREKERESARTGSSGEVEYS